MTLWHKPSEKPKGKDGKLLIFKKGKHLRALYDYELDWEKVDWLWADLTDILKLEIENKRLKKQIKDGYTINLDGHTLRIKEILK